MSVLILLVPGMLIAVGQAAAALSVLLLFPSLVYTSQLASATTRSTRFRQRFRWACLVGGFAYLGAWVAGLQGSESFADAVLGATFSAVGLVYCFIVDLLTPSSNVDGAVSDGKDSAPELFAIHESGELPEGVHCDPLKGILGMPVSTGSLTALVYEGKTKKEKMRVVYSVEDDLRRSDPKRTPEVSPLVDVIRSQENGDSGSAREKALLVGTLLFAGAVALARCPRRNETASVKEVLTQRTARRRATK